MITSEILTIIKIALIVVKQTPLIKEKSILNWLAKKNCGKVDEYIYFKNRVIGKGAYSTVYYGFNFNSFYEVAVKEFSSLSNPIRVRNEIKVLKKLEGMPHFPSIFKYYKKSGKNYRELNGTYIKKIIFLVQL